MKPNHRILALALLLVSCSDIGFGVPGSGTALPEGGVPVAQTLEGGVQVELTASGLTKILDIAQNSLIEAIEQSYCLGSSVVGDADVCSTTQGDCAPGCPFILEISSLELSYVDFETINVQIFADTSASIAVDQPLLSACTLIVESDDLFIDLDIGLSIDDATGSVQLQIDRVNDLEVSVTNSSGCLSISNRVEVISAVLSQLLDSWSTEIVSPAINELIGDLFPATHELAAMVDISALFLTGSAETARNALETRILPGGYARWRNEGLSLGVITGFNADADIETRETEFASEPQSCVADLAPFDFASSPFALSTTSRGTFALVPADEFLADPMPLGDIVIGISRSALDLAGHHMIAAGGLCLSRDREQLTFLRREILDDLLGVPLDIPGANLRIEVRPHKALRFAIGEGTPDSPHLIETLEDLEVQVDANINETWTPILTLAADVTWGMMLQTRHEEDLPAQIELTQSYMHVNNATADWTLSRYATLSVDDDMLAATLLNAILNNVGADTVKFLVPGISNLMAVDLTIEALSTTEDDFIAIYATLSEYRPPINEAALTPIASSVTVTVPTPEDLRLALLEDDEEGLPSVLVELDNQNDTRPKEYAWRLEGGAWHPYEATDAVLIRDRSFAWQGQRTIELRSRMPGDDSSSSGVGSVDVVIDYAPPTILIDEVAISDHLDVPARDSLSDMLQWSMSASTVSEPTTSWTLNSSLDLTVARALGDEIKVYVRDEAGNVAQALIRVSASNDANSDSSNSANAHHKKSSSGCQGAGSPDGLTVACLLIVWLRRKLPHTLLQH